MALVIPDATKHIRTAQKQTLTVCWEITRTDGVVLRFTTHNKQLTVDLQTYSPVGGFNASAREKSADMAVRNLEFVGMITSTDITTDDLRAGLYREAQVDEKLVDWTVPWIGPIAEARYWITETKFDGEIWEATVEGLTRWLQPEVGDVYSRICRYELGETKCGVNLADFTTIGASVDAVSGGDLTARRIIETDLSEADGVFDYGFVTWQTGNNAGLITEVQTYLNASGRLEFRLNTSYDIQVGDTFDITQGCDKLKATCDTKFSNFANFGGFPFMPGMNKLMAFPGAV